MIILSVRLSVGGNELTLIDEAGASHTVTLSDAVRLGLGRAVEEPSILPKEAPDDAVDFMERKCACLRYALSLLGMSDKSRRALSEKLRRKGYASDVCEAVLAVLEKNGYLDDAALCARYVRALAEGKHFGPHRLTAACMEKGFDRRTIEFAIEDAALDFDALAEEAWQSITAKKPPADKKSFEAARRKLLNLGYGYDTVRSVTADLRPDEEA